MHDVISAQDAAKMLGIHPGTLRNWRRVGRGPRVIRYGPRAIRYMRGDVQAFLMGCAVETEEGQ